MDNLPDETDGATPGPPSGFRALALDERLHDAVAALGFDSPTAVQSRAIPALLEGRDMIGRARTGSGKTAAFGLPLLERVKDGGANRALVLTPTRELAIQVGNALRSFAKRIEGLRIVTIYGGAPYPPQLKALANGATVVVGTPGRVIDHLERKSLDLSNLEVLVLDEADEMLRMGFIDDVEKLIAATPTTRQVALFSATMPERIRAVAQAHLKSPVEMEVESAGVTVDHIDQRWIFVPQRFKLEALVRVLRGVARGTTLVFARTRAACSDISERLTRDGFDIDALHGDLTQAAREQVMRRMRAQRLRIVIATDVAARGLDVEHIEHVVNFDMPDDTEGYVHRIGRTGRAGRAGTAISFITPRERGRLRDLERRLRTQITQIQVPTDTEIAHVEQSSLLASLLAVEDVSDARRYLAHVLETTELDEGGVAAAALTLYARHEGVSLAPPTEVGPPAWSRPPSHERRPQRDDRQRDDRQRDDRQRDDRRPQRERKPPTMRPAPNEPEVQLFFPLGKTKGVRAGDIVGLLANEAGIPGSAIGRIDVFSHKSFVSLPESVAQHVLNVLPRVALRGNDVPIALAHPRDQRPVLDRPSHKLRTHPKGPRRSHHKGPALKKPKKPKRP